MKLRHSNTRLYSFGVLGLLTGLAVLPIPGCDDIPKPGCIGGGGGGGAPPATTVPRRSDCTIALNPPGPDGIATYAAVDQLASTAPISWWIECITGRMIPSESNRIDIPIIKMSGGPNPKGQAKKLIGYVLGPPDIFSGVGRVKFWDPNAQDGAYFYRGDVEIELRHP